MELFLQNVGTAAQQVLILYIMVAVGFVADKLNVFTEKTAKATNDLMFYIVTPCMIVNSFLSTSFSKESATGFFIALGCSFIAHFVGMLLSTPLFNNKDDSDISIYKFASIYGNVGYMALPLTNAVLGSEGVFYGSSAVIVLNVLAFTHGIWLMNKGNGNKKFKLNFKSIILSPGIISVIIGLPLFLLSVQLPEVITKPISYISELNTPLAMIILGTYIANTNLKDIFAIKEHYIVVLIRLVAVPLLMLGFFKIINLDYILSVACIIAAAAPSANNTVMFAVKYGKNSGKASKIIAFTSFVSIITLPVMIALAMQL